MPCGARFLRIQALEDLLYSSEAVKCFECLMAETYTGGKPWKRLITKIESKATFNYIPPNQTTPTELVSVKWGAYVEDLELWICGLSNGEIGHMPKAEFSKVL